MSKEAMLTAEVAVLTELVRVLSDKVNELEAKQEQGEPVAYLCENAVGHKYFRWKKPTSIYKPIALYTTPQQRTWVGLTDEEVELYWDWEDFQTGAGRSTIFEMVRDIEAKLKEKNT